MGAGSVLIAAPLAGWSTSLDEVPDEVFAARMLGDGLAIDPTGDTLHAPCDGEITLIAQAHHALTLRAADGAEILMHVGLDTVALAGQGFALHVVQGARVSAGEPLLSFDLDFLARHAKSLLTPIILSAESGYRILRRSLDRELQAGEFLLEIVPAASAGAALASAQALPAALTRRLPVPLAHGLHARPAAMLAAALKNLGAEVRIGVRGREANARSTVALMGLGVQCDDEIEVRASGPDAPAALAALAAALAAAVERERAHAASASRAAVPTEPLMPSVVAGRLAGVIASRGLAVGSAVHLRRTELAVAEVGAGAAAENAALDQARTTVRSSLQRRVTAAGVQVPAAAREIAGAHLELLDDPELLSSARSFIAQGKGAGFAWRQAIRIHAQSLRSLTDARLRERVDDLLDLESQVLQGLAGPSAEVPQIPADAIILARELLPSQLLALDAERLAGLCLAQGGPTSHVALLAAAMGIPALVALGAEVLAIAEGTALVLEGEGGWLEVSPSPARLSEVRELSGARRERALAERAAAQRPCRTADGVRIEVLANIGSLAEAEAAVRHGAEGCGLLRTEFLFLDRQCAPSEAEQTAAYQQIALALGARPFTIRTLDAGGDKPIAYLPLPAEENPALGLRGVRTSLAYPQLLREQLRAVLGISAAAHLRLLLPMITDVADVQAVRAVLDQVRRELGRSDALSVGVMIETPASAVLAERLAAVADFLSIGTNDLTQYTLAMDRGHPQLAARLDALHPAVLQLIARAAQAATARGRPVAVCGGLASEPLAAALLVGLGVRELSAVPAAIPQLKACIARVTLAHCQSLAARALLLESATAVRDLLRQFSEEHG